MLGLFRVVGNGRPDAGKPTYRGLLCALLGSKRAATFPMVAAATIPLMGMIGAGLDMSRIYLVKSRLQQACDAGVLGARRVMTGATITATARTQGTNFFEANIRQGDYGTTSVGFDMDEVESGGAPTGTVSGVATAELPMTLMKIFGFREKALTTTCQATLNITNNDVLFVLDTTGSMSCLASDNSNTCRNYSGNSANIQKNAAGKYKTNEKNNSRIAGLRSAVVAFATALANATPDTARLRIGFVNYSSGVSVGSLLRGHNASYVLSGSYSFPSRLAHFDTPEITPTSEETYPSNISAANCTRYGLNQAFSGFTPTPHGSTEFFSPKSWNNSGPPFSGNNNRTCKRNRGPVTGKYLFSHFTYPNTGVSYDLSTYVGSYDTANSAVSVVTGDLSPLSVKSNIRTSYNMLQLAQAHAAGSVTGIAAAQVVSTRWDGCILERGGGLGDDIDTAPNSDATRWIPAWKEIIYNSGGDAITENSYSFHYACPKTGQLLTTITKDNVSSIGTYVNQGVTPTDFVAMGRTYHDIGMMWGARLMSTAGIFSSMHTAAPNNLPVTRHIIFMTDGDMDTSADSYSTYGADGSSNSAHNTRYLAACQAAKDRGAILWVVSFAQSLTSAMEQCASSEDHSFEADDTDDLNDAFTTIAQRIAELRLTQ